MLLSPSIIHPHNKTSNKPIFYVDGGTSGNGNFGHQRSVICGTDSQGKVIFFEEIGDKTNNEAELLAIIKVIESTEGDISIMCDSQLAVNLVGHRFHTKIDRLRELLLKIQGLQRIFKITWIPRDKNKAGWHIENTLGL